MLVVSSPSQKASQCFRSKGRVRVRVSLGNGVMIPTIQTINSNTKSVLHRRRRPGTKKRLGMYIHTPA